MPKNVENFEIRTLGREDYAQAAEIFAFVHALHQANRPDIYRKTNVPLGEDEFSKCAMTRTKSCCVRCETAKF